MIEAWLVYNQEDYTKNSYFADELITEAKKRNIHLELVLREKITLGIELATLYIKNGDSISHPEFVINRSRDSFLSKQLELMGIRVYNSYEITDLCNNKSLTHQWISKLGIPSVDTLFLNKNYLDRDNLKFSYPVVIKSVSGHGGNEVFKCTSKEAVLSAMAKIKENEFLIQQMCDNPGVDVRVFVIGDQIIGAIKRESKVDFRSNYSLGGKASIYELTEENKNRVQSILENLKSDFIGIDFMISQSGTFLFNEIEDVVGSRTLYEYGQINTAKEYIHYIAKTLL